MSRAERSVAMTADVDKFARRHLLRSDWQEDICFGLWRSSKGQTRSTTLLERLLLPLEGIAQHYILPRITISNVVLEPNLPLAA